MRKALCKYHGGDFYSAKWLIENAPENYEQMRFLEGCGGFANLLMQKKISVTEIYNEIHPRIYNVFDQVKTNSVELINRLGKIEYSESNFLSGKNFVSGTPVENAVAYLVQYRMSRGGLGKDFAWSKRLRGGKPGDLNAWQNWLKTLPWFAQRLQNVQLYNKNIFDILVWEITWDNTWIYLDPPFLAGTRKTKKAYEYEWDEATHIRLSKSLVGMSAKVMVAGYYSPLYNSLYKGWRVVTKDVPNNSGQTKTKERRLDCLFLNY